MQKEYHSSKVMKSMVLHTVMCVNDTNEHTVVKDLYNGNNHMNT